MTGIKKHRQTYYEHLHAKVTKLLFVVMFFDLFGYHHIFIFDRECTSNVWHAVSVLHWTFGVLHLFAMTTRYDATVAQVLGTAPQLKQNVSVFDVFLPEK